MDKIEKIEYKIKKKNKVKRAVCINKNMSF